MILLYMVSLFKIKTVEKKFLETIIMGTYLVSQDPKEELGFHIISYLT